MPLPAKKKFDLVNWVCLGILGPLFLGVFTYCPFKMPFIYCALCPVRCPWFYLRGYVLAGALVLNVRQNLFCARICPYGTLQVALAKISHKKIVLPAALRYAQWGSIVLLALLVWTSFHPQLIATTIAGISLGTLAIIKMRWLLLGLFTLSILLSIINYRCFCNHLCPVRTISGFLHRLGFKRRRGNDVFNG
ncbi:MAG: 4Fe-4S binding protein [Candidatus Omnitrophota bacterium]